MPVSPALHALTVIFLLVPHVLIDAVAASFFHTLQSSTTNPTPIQQAREALLMCIQQITIFAPNELMARLKLVFLDTIGFDDKDPTRCVRQTKLEERLQHMLLLLPRDSSSMQGVTTHLQRSPFIQRLVIAHRDPSSPAAGPPPKLYAVVFP